MLGTASRFIPLKRAAAYPTTTGIRQLAQVLTEPDGAAAAAFLKKWCFRAAGSRPLGPREQGRLISIIRHAAGRTRQILPSLLCGGQMEPLEEAAELIVLRRLHLLDNRLQIGLRAHHPTQNDSEAFLRLTAA